MVIDSGPTYAYAQQAYTVMQNKEKLPVKYVINTSANELNILGNEFYKELGATLIGPKSYEELIKKQKPLSMLEKLSNTVFSNTRLIPLDIYQNEDTTIHIGNTKIEIKKLEKNESKNLVIYVPQEKSIFVGNYIANKRIPSLKEHDSINEWIANLETIESLSWKHIISSHGVERKRTALNTTKNYLATIKKTVLTSIKTSSKDIDKNSFKDYQHIAFFNDFNSANIQKAYDELKTNKVAKITNDEQAILSAMSTIKTNEVLKEGTGKMLILSEKTPTVHKKKPQVKKSTIKKAQVKSKKVNLKRAKVEIIDETSVQSIIKKASKTKVAPTTEEVVPSIRYDKDFFTAQRHALKEHKMVLIKVEADGCEPCMELDQELASNKTLRKMINKYTKAIKINTSYESVPLGLTNMGTPTVFVINPKTESILVKLEGIDAIKDLEDSLRTVTSESKGSLAFSLPMIYK